LCYSEEINSSLSNTIKAGAFADPSATKPNPRLPVLDTEDVPFAKLLAPTTKQQPGQTDACKKQQDNNENNNTTKTSTESNSRRSSCSAADDFIMVDLVRHDEKLRVQRLMFISTENTVCWRQREQRPGGVLPRVSDGASVADFFRAANAG
jgi:hypothetical protein